MLSWGVSGERSRVPVSTGCGKGVRNGRRQRPTACAHCHSSTGSLVATAQAVDGVITLEVGETSANGGFELRTVVHQPVADGVDIFLQRRPTVTALALFEDATRGRKLLCVGSTDGTALYQLSGGGTRPIATIAPPLVWIGLPSSSTTASSPVVEVESVTFDPTGLLVAVCTGRKVEVLQTSFVGTSQPPSERRRDHDNGGGGAYNQSEGYDKQTSAPPPPPLMVLSGFGSVVVRIHLDNSSMYSIYSFSFRVCRRNDCRLFATRSQTGSCFHPKYPHILISIAQVHDQNYAPLAALLSFFV